MQSILYKHVNEIAKGIPDSDARKKDYVAAALTFRLPYWDWARRDTTTYFPLEALDDVYDRSQHPKSTASWFAKPGNVVYNPLHHAPFPAGVTDRQITKVCR